MDWPFNNLVPRVSSYRPCSLQWVGRWENLGARLDAQYSKALGYCSYLIRVITRDQILQIHLRICKAILSPVLKHAATNKVPDGKECQLLRFVEVCHLFENLCFPKNHGYRPELWTVISIQSFVNRLTTESVWDLKKAGHKLANLAVQKFVPVWTQSTRELCKFLSVQKFVRTRVNGA